MMERAMSAVPEVIGGWPRKPCFGVQLLNQTFSKRFKGTSRHHMTLAKTFISSSHATSQSAWLKSQKQKTSVMAWEFQAKVMSQNHHAPCFCFEALGLF